MSKISNYFKKIQNKKEKPFQIPGIDYIYLINLDRRPEKLEKSLNQLSPFGISPQRFPAIYGWDLNQEAFDEIGLKFLPPMDFRYDGQVLFQLDHAQEKGDPLNESSYGRTCVNHTTSAGSIGGSLSHLSCIQDGFDSGYETIWILEDDFTVRDDPRYLAYFLYKLSLEVGGDGWDVLYTDDNHIFPQTGSKITYLRPDRPPFEHLYEKTPVGADFHKIGARLQLHSVIYRRSGMKKILDYIKTFGLFHTLDVEINYTPGIRLYNLRCDLIHGSWGESDTQKKNF